MPHFQSHIHTNTGCEKTWKVLCTWLTKRTGRKMSSFSDTLCMCVLGAGTTNYVSKRCLALGSALVLILFWLVFHLFTWLSFPWNFKLLESRGCVFVTLKRQGYIDWKTVSASSCCLFNYKSRDGLCSKCLVLNSFLHIVVISYCTKLCFWLFLLNSKYSYLTGKMVPWNLISWPAKIFSD